MKRCDIEVAVERLVLADVIESGKKTHAVQALQQHWNDQAAEVWSAEDILYRFPWLSLDQAYTMMEVAYSRYASMETLKWADFQRLVLELGYKKPGKR